MSDSQDRTPPLSSDVAAAGRTLLTQHGSDAVPLQSSETRVPSAEKTFPAITAPGQMIAGYAVEGELGRGGMGVVYRARQPGLNRLVALKMILHADHAGTEDRLRFLREAEALARLRHENIVQVYEVGEHDGKPFFSLEYVEGGSLDQQLKGTPLPPREAAALVEKLAGGVQCAHDAGIIHRDLKPANVLIVDRGSWVVDREAQPSDSSRSTTHDPRPTMIPKITDFGLAKKQDEAGLSASGAVMGTPSYMAPEQALGKGRDIDARTDVYALGAILYECLTGRPPFRAATAVDTLLQVLTDEPVSVRSLQPGTPPDIETICLKCLQKEPARRYASARELAGDLGRFLRGEPVQARPVGRVERGWRWCRRNPVVAGLLASVGVLLVLVAGVSTVLGQLAWRKAGEAERKAGEADEAREGEKNKAEEEARQRHRAEDEEARTKQLLYAGRLALAQSYWQEGNVVAARDKLDETQEHRHTWEHRYLYTLMNHRGQRTLLGHTAGVSSVAFSPDGKHIASGSWDQTAKVWDAASGKELLTLKGHTKRVLSVSFSLDGKRLVSGSEDRTVRVWDTVTGQDFLTLKGHRGPVKSVAFSPDGKRIASGSADRTVKLWDAETGKALLTLKGHTFEVHSVSFSPDGKRLASGIGQPNYPGEVKVWDVRTGKALLTLKGHRGPVSSVSFSPDGNRLASGSEERTVTVWDAATGQNLLTLKGHTKRILGVSFSPDGQRIASGSEDQTVKMWDAGTGQELLSLKGHTKDILSVNFSPDGKRIVSGSWDRTAKVWDAATGQDLLSIKGHTASVLSVSFSPDGKRLASGSADRTVKVWDTATGQHLLTIKGRTAGVGKMSFSPNGKRLASGSSQPGFPGEVNVWDAATGQELLTLKGHTDRISSVSFSPDGKRLASASLDQMVKVWDAETGKDLLTLKGHTSEVHSVSFSPDGKCIASGSKDKTMKLWDTVTGQELLTLNGHTGEVFSVSFSPDGKRIASGSGDQSVKVWDAASGQELLSLRGHTSHVYSVCFSPDGKRLVSGSGDQTVMVWDAQTGQDLLTLKGHTSHVSSVSFSPDGKWIASGSGAFVKPGEVMLWDATMGQDLLTLKGHTDRVSSMSFSADGNRIAARDVTGKQITWDIATGQPIAGAVEQAVSASPRSPDGGLFAVAERMAIRVHRLPTGKEAVQTGHRWWVDPDFRWHAAQADEAWHVGDWFAAAFHLDRLLREQPWDAQLHVQRAHALRQQQRNSEAATAVLQALLLDPHCSWRLPTSKAPLVIPRIRE